jgi:hypothetical protein
MKLLGATQHLDTFPDFTHCYVAENKYVPALLMGVKEARKKPEGILAGANALMLAV